MAEKILDVKNLNVGFKSKSGLVTAVEGVSFSIEKGSTLGLVGESGCGKSVTATSILRLLPKDTSEIKADYMIFEGEDLMKLDDEGIRKIRGGKISMIFQEPMSSLNPVYKIGDQMIEMLQAHQKISKEVALEKSIEMLKKVGIPSPELRINEYPHQMSGGMLQRVMIAMALSTDPSLLIADEPTTALDVTIQAQILDLMNHMKESYRASIMLITHDMGVIAEVADKVMVMYAGQVVEYDDVESIFNNPLHPYTRGLLKSIPKLDSQDERLYTIDGVVPSIDQFPPYCRFYDRCEERMEICKKKKCELFKVNNKQVRCLKFKDEAGDNSV